MHVPSFIERKRDGHEHSAAELEEFNEFYSSSHLPDVIKNNSFYGGTRYELLTENGQVEMPRYLALYAADRAVTLERDREQAAAALAPSGGVAGRSRQLDARVWQERTTHWRLVYRLVEGG